MNVQQLIETLQELDPTLEVILSTDPEGNGFSPLHDEISEGHYNSRLTEFYTDEDLDYLKQDDDEEENDRVPSGYVHWVCVWR